MNKILSTLAISALMCSGTLAFATDDMKSDAMHSKMSTMDANGDGVISKEEYMNYYQSAWDKMPKNKDGMVTMKDMQMMHHDHMMKHDGMMKDQPMKDGSGN
jgi:hypothetical protein